MVPSSNGRNWNRTTGASGRGPLQHHCYESHCLPYHYVPIVLEFSHCCCIHFSLILPSFCVKFVNQFFLRFVAGDTSCPQPSTTRVPKKLSTCQVIMCLFNF